MDGRLRRILLCVALEMGALAGVPMRPEEIRKLLEAMAGPKTVHVARSEDDRGDGDPDREPTER
jgi:hypothetical protein